MPTRDTGQIFMPGHLLMLKRFGIAEGPNGKYELMADEHGQPVIRSLVTNRKFLLSWQNIMEIAVENGIDDKQTAPDVS